MTKPLNIGVIGYGFMGRAHSNAYRKVNNFFDLEHRPVLKAVCARSADKAKAFADKWGYESVETDWRKPKAQPGCCTVHPCTSARQDTGCLLIWVSEGPPSGFVRRGDASK